MQIAAYLGFYALFYSYVTNYWLIDWSMCVLIFALFSTFVLAHAVADKIK